MMFIILTLIVAVAAFNLVSTLVMTVTDKRADIAILRTLGASPKSIMGIFVVQGAMVGVIGTLAGLLRQIDPSYEEAAMNLGASRGSVFRTVTLPLMVRRPKPQPSADGPLGPPAPSAG